MFLLFTMNKSYGLNVARQALVSFQKLVKYWPLIHLPVTIVHSISKAWGIYSC